MQKWKIIITLVTVVALTITLIGLASAQIGVYQNTTNANPNTATNNGFWGWIGNCFRFRSNQPTTGQNIVPTSPSQPSSTNSTPASPNQGSYNYGVGRCWARW
jgi:hypothetical protein